MLKVLLSAKGIQAARIGRIAVVLLIATSSSGCATLMQPFSVQPTAALAEAESNTGSSASDEVRAESAATPVDGQWVGSLQCVGSSAPTGAL